MLKVAVLANCQGGAIKASLKNHLQDNIHILDIPPVYTFLHDDSMLHDIFKKIKLNCDYVLMQPLKDRFGPLSLESIKENTHCKVITFPSIIFNGYNPEMFTLKNFNGQTLRGFKTDFHDINILSCYLSGLNPTLTANKIKDQKLYSKSVVENIWDTSILLFREHEIDCDIKISKLIEINKRHVLFHTMTHPNNLLLEYIIYEILKKLSYTGFFEPFISNILSSTHFAIYPSVIQSLSLKEYTSTYLFDNIEYSVENAINEYYNYYASLDQNLLEYNYNSVSKSKIMQLVLNSKVEVSK